MDMSDLRVYIEHSTIFDDEVEMAYRSQQSTFRIVTRRFNNRTAVYSHSNNIISRKVDFGN